MTLQSRIPQVLLIAIVGLMAVGLLAPTGQCGALPQFIDYDGDGFDDGAPDDDGDGIPDEIEFHSFFSAQQNLVLGVNQMSIGTPAPAPKPCAAERFGALEFTTRAVSASRSDFDAGFGGSLGLGGGLGGGGACAGGICF